VQKADIRQQQNTTIVSLSVYYSFSEPSRERQTTTATKISQNSTQAIFLSLAANTRRFFQPDK